MHIHEASHSDAFSTAEIWSYGALVVLGAILPIYVIVRIHMMLPDLWKDLYLNACLPQVECDRGPSLFTYLFVTGGMFLFDVMPLGIYLLWSNHEISHE